MVGLVGILNVTPDSFSDGGKFIDPTAAISQAESLFRDGAELLDIGAESTRPGATPLTSAEEWQRLEPVLKALLPVHPGKISLDSYHPETITRAFAIGPVIINDVTGMNAPAMIDIVLKYHAIVIISHHPDMDIQRAHLQKPVTDIETVRQGLLAKATLLQHKGLPKDHIILDPGIGFGKTAEVNWKLLRCAELVPEYPVMIGYSRKRFLGSDRMELASNLAAGAIAVDAGARYLRVHDVAGHRKLQDV